LKAVEKAIQMSDIGINPTNDGKSLRIVFPTLTEERRRELSKSIKKLGEDSKVAIRSIRRDAIEKFKAAQKKSEITEDDLKQLESETQKQTDKRIAEVDELIKAKDKEIMEI
ncbi:MAG: ribosome-recycling factor, partial [Oscillospiraceae bacterium]|nr:ribosome-recycling factor [Oscillospiraceae bacterium]